MRQDTTARDEDREVARRMLRQIAADGLVDAHERIRACELLLAYGDGRQ